jgi:hypothetical protein
MQQATCVPLMVLGDINLMFRCQSNEHGSTEEYNIDLKVPIERLVKKKNSPYAACSPLRSTTSRRSSTHCCTGYECFCIISVQCPCWLRLPFELSKDITYSPSVHRLGSSGYVSRVSVCLHVSFSF